ncbi:phosphatidylinositol 3-kinase regulatory subunit alpha [Drosophila busckii]|uniref:phosphatidylinositol 3-kinase regulatory subunit alpha n=1 Tax=Drosophila busckii TaxID=30019 RepID=UPI001432B99E|nr:phosphatidylinositol 3-kinase regulatory subunit alpha [Drosophila busckii]
MAPSQAATNTKSLVSAAPRRPRPQQRRRRYSDLNPIYCPHDDNEVQPQGDMRSLSDDLIRYSQLLLQQKQQLDQKKTSFNAIREELIEQKQNQGAFVQAEKMIRSQIAILESFMKVPPVNANGTGSCAASAANVSCSTRQEEHEHMRENLSKLKAHLEIILSKESSLNMYIKMRKEEEQLLERQINATKPEIQELLMRKDKLCQRLKSFGLTEDDLNTILDVGYDDWKDHYEKVSNLPHRNESSWLLKDCKRSDAEELLKGAPTGTFLIRARDVGHYALSIVCHQAQAGLPDIHHCIIFEQDTGFGFAAPYNIYPTLNSLVEHYACNSLEEHNDVLTTVLRLPVYYWIQNKQLVLEQELPPPPTANIPIPASSRAREREDVATSSSSSLLSSSETKTPPTSISPSNFGGSGGGGGGQ